MTLLIICLPCSLALRVMPARVGSMNSQRELRELVGEGSTFWLDKYPCPACEVHTSAVAEIQVDPRVLSELTVLDVTPHEAFAALHGMGLPEEQKCSLERVEELLREQPIRRVIGSTVEGAPPRTTLDALELWDGTKLYFAGTSGTGAVIYRITRPVSYTKKVLAEMAPEGEAACPP